MSRIALAAAAVALLLPLTARAASAPVSSQVAGAFIAAAQAQDHTATLALLDEGVLIQFPSAADQSRPDHAAGQPFVIGYLDGLFGARRALSLDGVAQHAGAVRFLAHDARSQDRYVIDVEVRGSRVVGVVVDLESVASSAVALAPS